jgi:hypothetical protein
MLHGLDYVSRRDPLLVGVPKTSHIELDNVI